ncbi:type II toxin-antitoxin system HicA family toxin [Sphaerospermopsis sp. LEGE 08334]|jgi:mRNA interferase HicA|nr:type II toxin-antitoxin system HicA family toxin [Sphaerospermopsis sp. LEGE 08334]
MKRKELEKKLRQAGCYLKREGGSHSLLVTVKITN